MKKQNILPANVSAIVSKICKRFQLLLSLSWLLLEVDDHLHGCLSMTVDKLVSIVILLQCEAVADERLQIYDALAHIVDGGDVILMAIHHGTDETKLMLAQVEHAEGWVLGEYRYHNDVATFLDGLHQGADGRFHTCNLETYLVPLLAEELLGSLLQWLLGDVEGMLDATLTSLVKTEVAHIGDEYVLGTTGDTELSHEVADGSGTAHYHVLALHVGTVAGMCAYGRRLNHGTIVEAHSLRKFHHTVIVYHEEILCASIGLESLYAEVLTYVVLTTLARIALATYQLRASGDVVAWLANCNLATASHYYARVLVALNHRVEGGWVQTMVRVNLTTADANALDVNENLMSRQIGGLRFCYFFEYDVFWFYQYSLSHNCKI